LKGEEMFRKGIVEALLVIFMASSLLSAKSNTTNKETTQNVRAMQEAKRLLEEMNLEKVYKNAVKNSTNRIIRANPKLKKVEGQIKSFYERYIGWGVMKEDLAKLYTKYFTADELIDITNFYKTKTGKKVLSTMGRLAYEGQRLTRKRLLPHMKELQKILDDALRDGKKRKKGDN
jgi:hypothetical protein